MGRNLPRGPEQATVATTAVPRLDLSATAIRGGAIRVMGFASGILVSLGAATILIRHLGISDFGRFVTVASLIGLVGGATEAGIAAYGIREFTLRARADRRQLIANLLGLRLSLTAIGIACAVAFAVAAGYPNVLVLGTVLVGVGLLMQVMVDVLAISLQAQLLLGRLTVVDLTRRLLALGLIAALALADARLLPFLAVPALAGTSALALLAWIVRSSITLKINLDWPVWRKLAAETLPFAIAVSIGAFYFYVTVIMMSLISSAHQTGLFATAFRVVQVALGVPALVLTAIYPIMSRQHANRPGGLGPTAGKVLTVALIGGLWMSLCMAMGAGLVVHAIAGGQARPAAAVLRIQSLVLTLNFVSTSAGFCLLAQRRYRPLIIAGFIALLVNLALALILIPSHGARGGAIADVLTEAGVAASLTLCLFRSVSPRGIAASLAPCLLLACVLASSMWLIPVGALVRIVGATIIYFGVVALTKTIPSEVTAATRGVPVIRALLERPAR
jgi:O-antigen/teichoic acid export membrane protein